jgi:hypothetical protein
MANFNNKMNYNSNHKAEGLATKPILAILVVIVLAAMYFYFSGPRDVNAIGTESLKDIRAGNIQAAYDLTSTSFKKQTTFDAYTAFIGQYPILQQYTSFTFNQKLVDKKSGTAAIGGILVGGDGRQMQIQFQFSKEDKAWRVQGMGVIPLGNAAPPMEADSSGSTVKAIVVSDQADGDGYVEKGKSAVDKLAAKIYVTAQINAPKAGGKVEATLTETSNGQKFGPTVDDIEKAGNILKAFAFTKVTNAWDAGAYEATIKLSSGDTKTFKFEIKEPLFLIMPCGC